MIKSPFKFLLVLSLCGTSVIYAMSTNAQQPLDEETFDSQLVNPVEVDLQNLSNLPAESGEPVVIPRPGIPIGEEALDQIKANPNCIPEAGPQNEGQPGTL